MYPNKPYTILGIPERVSAVILIILTILPSLAYSVRYIAEKIDIGRAIIRVTTIIEIVLIIEGSIETFSDVYFSENKLGLSSGTPSINT